MTRRPSRRRQPAASSCPVLWAGGTAARQQSCLTRRAPTRTLMMAGHVTRVSVTTNGHGHAGFKLP
jgi:hypothetical protein